MQIVRDVLGVEFWLAAGFVRNPCWDAWYGDGGDWQPSDIDVLYIDPGNLDSRRDASFEARLRAVAPSHEWEVRNQARMHLRNQDPPYHSVAMAMQSWLEVATGIAVRMDEDGRLCGETSYGWEDLLAGIYRPTAAGLRKPDQLIDRLTQKRMRTRWPKVQFLLDDPVFSQFEREARA